MSRAPDAHYGGFDIYVVVTPADQGGFSAISDVERKGADGVEVFQDFGGPCDSGSADDARDAVLIDTKRKIDDLNAEPV